MWDAKKTVIFLIPFALLLVAALLGWLLRNTIRTRFAMERQLRADPDTNEWIVAFDWSRKILYTPTILVSLVAAVLMYFHQAGRLPSLNPYVLGGVWLAVFFANFLIDEYEMGLKVLLIIILVLLVLGLWLTLLGWLGSFLNLFRHVRIYLNATTYLVLAGLFALAVLISWLHGLFHFVAITPNYLNIQTGPTESAEQVTREEFSTRIDTGDFLERILGYGRIIITFANQRRPPMILLVGRIGKRAVMLESIRGTLVVDRPGEKMTE
jgi:hypothetical protein